MSAPRFKSQYRIRIAPPDLVFFVDDYGYRVMEGALLCKIAPYIDGKRTSSDIAKRLKGKVTEADVECGLLLLEAEGYLADEKPEPNLKLTVAPRRIRKRFKTHVISFCETSADKFGAILLEQGTHASIHRMRRDVNDIQCSQDGCGTFDFTIVLANDYLQPELADFNWNALKNKTTWMPVQFSERVLWLGPVFSPPHTPCWNCLAERLKEKRRLEAFLKMHGSKTIYNAKQSQPETALLKLAARQTSRLLEKKLPHLLTFDVSSRKSEIHPVFKRTDCSVCGKRSSRSQPIQKRSAAKNLSRHISLRTGVVDEIKTFHIGPIYSAVADHVFVPMLDRANLLKKGLTQKSWGRGFTEADAKTGALCESLERYSGVFRGTESRIRKSFEELQTQAIHLNSCLNFSEEQFRSRTKSNRLNNAQEWIPLPLDPRNKTDWTPVYSLTNHVFRYLPTAYCYYGYPQHQEKRFCRADSNGNAAGKTLHNAIVRGFLELVERDCAAIWWYNRLLRPGVDLESFDLPFLKALQRTYKSAGRDFWVLDITNDFGIPCFAALSAKSRFHKNYLMGLGAHFDPLIALKRALTEMSQFLPLEKTKTEGIDADGPYLKPDPASIATTPDDFAVRRGTVDSCIRLSKKLGLEMFVLDQTREDVGLPVAKVIIPGMRQHWRRLAPGRLYDVPVRLGWLRKPLSEKQLNPDRILI